MLQCQNYLRLVQDHIATQAGSTGADEASVTPAAIEDDKTMAMMGLAKTIEAVELFSYGWRASLLTRTH